MIQAPPTIAVTKESNSSSVAADYLESVVNKNATDGWEFYRVDLIGVSEEPGCLAGLGGQKATNQQYFVVTFRKPRDAHMAQ